MDFPAPVSPVSMFSPILIDIHGQHEHQSLLKAAKQLEILDEYAGEELYEPKRKLKECYERYKEIEEQILAEDVDGQIPDRTDNPLPPGYSHSADCRCPKAALQSSGALHHMKLQHDEETRKRETSLAEFEVQEIEEAALIDGEDATLHRDFPCMILLCRITVPSSSTGSSSFRISSNCFSFST